MKVKTIFFIYAVWFAAIIWVVFGSLVQAEAQNPILESITEEGFIKEGGQWVVNGITLEISFPKEMSNQDQFMLRKIAREINQELGVTAVVTYGHGHEGCVRGNAISEICLDQDTHPHLCCGLGGEGVAGRAKQVVLGWGLLNSRRPFVFDKIKGQYGFYPSTHLSYKTGDIAECDIHIHRDQRQFHWFETTINHEILHCLGFAHYEDGIMYPLPTNGTKLPEHIIDKWWAILNEKYGGFFSMEPLYHTFNPLYESVILKVIK